MYIWTTYQPGTIKITDIDSVASIIPCTYLVSLVYTQCPSSFPVILESSNKAPDGKLFCNTRKLQHCIHLTHRTSSLIGHSNIIQ